MPEEEKKAMAEQIRSLPKGTITKNALTEESTNTVSFAKMENRSPNVSCQRY